MKLFYGEENYLINQAIQEISDQMDVKPLVFNDNDAIEDIIMELTTVSMFYDKKLTVIKNHPVLSDEKMAQKFLREVSEDKDSEIIFVWEEWRLPKSLLVEKIKQEKNTKEFKRLQDNQVAATIKDIVQQKGGSISNAAAIKMANKVPAQLRIIILEIEKLLAESMEITESMIEISIGEYVKEDAYTLANALSANDHALILQAYIERKRAGDEPTYLIGQLSSVLSLALQVIAWRSQGLSNYDISEQTKIHIFRIKKVSDLIVHSSPENIKSLLIALANLDADIKTGQVDVDLGLDNFILNLVK